MTGKLKNTLARVYFRTLSVALSYGLTLPFEWVDRLRFIDFREKKITLSEIYEEKEKLIANIMNAQKLQTDPKYLELNKASLDYKARLRIAILKNAKENHLLVDIFEDLKDSAISVGHVCEIFTGSVLQFKSKNTTLENDALEQFEPDLVIAEAHNDPAKFYASENSNLLTLKSKLGFKIFLISIDLWRDSDVKFIQSWRHLYDVLVHLDIQSINEFEIERDFWWPYFAHPHTHNDGNVRHEKVVFSGNLRFPDRRSWLYQTSRIARQMKVKLKVEALNYTSAHWKSRKEYVKELKQASACLNFSQKKTGFTLITFRTLDIISAGSALLQQEDPESMPLRDFLVPYLHYIPFTSKLQLSAIFLLMKENYQLVQSIAKSGSEFYRSQYSKTYLWSILENRFKLEVADE